VAKLIETGDFFCGGVARVIYKTELFKDMFLVTCCNDSFATSGIANMYMCMKIYD
jgi:hypothetical protein